MGFLDELGKKVTDAGQKTMQKTKDITDIARINSLITQEENKIYSTYHQIGKMYVSIHGMDYEPEFSDMIAGIADSEQKVQAYRKQIQDIKGIQHCLKCGAEIPRGAAFCSSCGALISHTNEQKNLEESVKCMKCGSFVKKGMRFCTSCGEPLSQPTAAGELAR